MAQESLTNAICHARARTIRVQLMMGTGGVVELRVVDDGVGFVTSGRVGGGLGLRSIDERVGPAGVGLPLFAFSGDGPPVGTFKTLDLEGIVIATGL